MIHSVSPQSWPAVKICFVLDYFEKLGRTDVLTTCVDIVITTGLNVVGLVDQLKSKRSMADKNILIV